MVLSGRFRGDSDPNERLSTERSSSFVRDSRLREESMSFARDGRLRGERGNGGISSRGSARGSAALRVTGDDEGKEDSADDRTLLDVKPDLVVDVDAFEGDDRTEGRPYLPFIDRRASATTFVTRRQPSTRVPTDRFQSYTCPVASLHYSRRTIRFFRLPFIRSLLAETSRLRELRTPAEQVGRAQYLF